MLSNNLSHDNLLNMKYAFFIFPAFFNTYIRKIKAHIFHKQFIAISNIKLLKGLSFLIYGQPAIVVKKLRAKLPRGLVGFYQIRWRAIALSIIILTIIFVLGGLFGKNQMQTFDKLSIGLTTADEYLTLAQDYENAKQFGDAERSYMAAINLDPARQLAAYSALARLYSEVFPAKKEEIGRLYLRGIAQNPASRVLMQGLAQYYESEGHIDQALEWYHRIVSIYPQDTASRYKLIELQRAQ